MKTETSAPTPRIEPGPAPPPQETPPASVYQYDAFISYSSRSDYNRARRVEGFLESFHRISAPQESPIRRLQICRDGSDFKLPSRRGTTPLEENEPVWDIIRTELAKARYLIVLCSPGAVASTWVPREISWMIQHRGTEWILPVVTEAKDPINNPGECFPEKLRAANIHQDRIWYDLRELDRASGALKARNYEDELVRLASDLLDWQADKYGPLATIWEREQLKRRRRQATIAMIVAAIVIVIAGLAIWQAVVANRQARRARANAITQTADASFDPLTAALLLMTLSPDEEPEGGMRVAEKLASTYLPQANMRGHTGRVTKVAFSPDQKYLLTASLDGASRIWPVDGRGDPVMLSRHAKAVTDARFSSDGSLIATASEDQTARVWRAGVWGEPLRAFEHEGVVKSAQFTFDDRWLMTISEGQGKLWRLDGTVSARLALPENRAIVSIWLSDKSISGWVAASDSTIWSFVVDDHNTLAIKPALPRPPRIDPLFPATGIDKVTFSPDGSHVAMIFDKQALVESTNGASQPVILAHDDLVNSIDFDLNGAHAVTSCSDGKARVWGTDSGRMMNALDTKIRFWLVDLFGKPAETQKESPLSVSQALFSHNGSRILTFSQDGVVRVWKTDNSGQPLELSGLLGAEVAAFNRDDTQLAIGADDGTARVWSLSPPAEPLVLNHLKPVYAASFSQDGSRVVTASSDGIARVWMTGDMTRKIELNANAGNVRGAVFNRQGSRVATAHGDGSARLWDISETERPVLVREFSKHEESLNGLQFSPDEKSLLTWSEDGTARLWSVDVDRAPIVLSGSAGNVWDAEFSPNGSHVLTTYEDGTARIWKTDGSGRSVLLGGKDGHTGTIFDGAFSPDGTYALTVSRDGTARIWRSDGQGVPVVLTGANPEQEWMEKCAYSPAGESVVTTSSAGRVWVWRADGTGRPIELRFTNDLVHVGSVTSVVFSNDGQRIVTSGGWDGAVRIWQADGSGRPINLIGHGGTVTDARFSSDGKRVVSASEDGVVRIWRTRWADLLAYLRSVTTATLTVEQRLILLGETEADAREAYEASELQMGRTPLPRDWKFQYPF